METQRPDPGPVIEGLPAEYRLIRELSRDPWGAVHLAEDRARGGQVTITALGPLPDPGGLDRLARALDAVAGLRHPGILPVRAVADAAGRAYLVAPRVDDPDLGQRLAAQGPLPLPTALQILGPLADALDAAHRVGVVHGGLRPAVVRFSPGAEWPYLTGFGAAAGRAPEAAANLAAAEHRAPEQITGAPTDRRTDVYAFGGLLFRCLTGVPPFRGDSPQAVLTAGLHADPPRVSAYRPDLPGELDRVVATAMAKNPALRFDTCRAVVDAAAAAGVRNRALPHPVAAARRRTRWRIVLAALTVVVLVAGGVAAAPRVAAAFWPTAEDLAQVPAAVRGDCALAAADQRLPAAGRVLRCSDEQGQDLLIGLFGTASEADAAYRGIVSSSPGVRTGHGDCARTSGSEHRYPGVGDLRGRVACDRTGSTARIAWMDRPDRAVGLAERADGDAAELYRSWSRWVELPAFPTPEEQQLLDLLDEDPCERAPAGPLDGLDGVVAAVECAPLGTGAGAVTYYRFAAREGLQRAYGSDATRFAAPAGVYCPSTDGAGDSPYYQRVFTVGRLACGPDGAGAPAVTWTNDALLVMARATGTDRAGLIDWWTRYSGPRTRTWIDAVNQQSTPPFPTPQEDAVLARIPVASRVGCMRPPADIVRQHLGDADADGVTCTTANGPDGVYYYWFRDPAALNALLGPGGGADCLTAPPGSPGAARYARPDGSSGILRCGTNGNGEAFLVWSDEQASVFGLAFDTDPARLLPWWQTEAGPN